MGAVWGDICSYSGVWKGTFLQVWDETLRFMLVRTRIDLVKNELIPRRLDVEIEMDGKLKGDSWNGSVM